MPRSLVAAALLIWLLVPLSDTISSPVSSRANYSIKVMLDPIEKQLHGSQRVLWQNPSQQTVRFLYFHLYLNAFMNNQSSFMLETEGKRRGRRFAKGKWGWIKVDRLAIGQSADLTSAIQYLSPDDGNTEDRTLMRVPLPRPLAPREECVITIDFTAKLPQVFSRTGYRGDFFLVAQWFPKIAAYDPARGGWNAHQFHGYSEFFADYGTYDVSVTVPSSFIVGAVGELRNKRENADSTTTYRYYQEDVHDFAWTADPHFHKYQEVFEHPELPSVRLTLLLQPDHLGQKDRHFRAIKAALRYFGEWYGPYPYTTLTIVDPPKGARGAAGMEYPTFITAGTRFQAPRAILSPEGVLVHEFGHQYWYGLVANNEFEEAWLDEGINSYAEAKVLQLVYGDDHDYFELLGLRVLGLPLLEIGNTPIIARMGRIPLPQPYASRTRYKESVKLDPTTRASWEYHDADSYTTNSYSKPELIFRTLEAYLGDDGVRTLLRSYFQRWMFRHPTVRDFLKVADETTDRVPDRFFEQLLFGSDILDYAIAEATSRPLPCPEGIFLEEGQAVSREGGYSGLFRTRVVVRRLGEVQLPVTILMVFQDGVRIEESWSGKERWVEYLYLRPSPLAFAAVDPDQQLVLDVNLLNNSRSVPFQSRAVTALIAQWVFWVQNVLQFLAFPV